MKFNIILGILVIILGYVTCKNLKKSAEPSTPNTSNTTPEYDRAANFKASRFLEGNNPDTAFTRQVTAPPHRVEVPWDKIMKPSTSRRAYMASGWWFAKMAYQPSDTTVHIHYMDKWLKFKEDQTFEIFMNGKVVDKGNWGYEEKNGTPILYISCNDVYFNNTWAIQERGFRMVWKGNTELNFTGIQIRMDNAPTPPWQN
jgi:hypothetical protein